MFKSFNWVFVEKFHIVFDIGGRERALILIQIQEDVTIWKILTKYMEILSKFTKIP